MHSVSKYCFNLCLTICFHTAISPDVALAFDSMVYPKANHLSDALFPLGTLGIEPEIIQPDHRFSGKQTILPEIQRKHLYISRQDISTPDILLRIDSPELSVNPPGCYNVSVLSQSTSNQHTELQLQVSRHGIFSAFSQESTFGILFIDLRESLIQPEKTPPAQTRISLVRSNEPSRKCSGLHDSCHDRTLGGMADRKEDNSPLTILIDFDKDGYLVISVISLTGERSYIHTGIHKLSQEGVELLKAVESYDNVVLTGSHQTGSLEPFSLSENDIEPAFSAEWNNHFSVVFSGLSLHGIPSIFGRIPGMHQAMMARHQRGANTRRWQQRYDQRQPDNKVGVGHQKIAPAKTPRQAPTKTKSGSFTRTTTGKMMTGTVFSPISTSASSPALNPTPMPPHKAPPKIPTSHPKKESTKTKQPASASVVTIVQSARGRGAHFQQETEFSHFPFQGPGAPYTAKKVTSASKLHTADKSINQDHIKIESQQASRNPPPVTHHEEFPPLVSPQSQKVCPGAVGESQGKPDGKTRGTGSYASMAQKKPPKKKPSDEEQLAALDREFDLEDLTSRTQEKMNAEALALMDINWPVDVKDLWPDILKGGSAKATRVYFLKIIFKSKFQVDILKRVLRVWFDMGINTEQEYLVLLEKVRKAEKYKRWPD
ncbi:MAG: hypothetical protein ACR2PT_04165 [Endozoicomonas sp.]